MSRDDVIRRLRQHQAELRRFGVCALFLFGSTARDDARPESDVDLYFDYDDPKFSLIELAELQSRLERLLGSPIDVMSRASLHPRLRSAIEHSAVQVF